MPMRDEEQADGILISEKLGVLFTDLSSCRRLLNEMSYAR
jgi:hypothetical protein